MSPETQRLIAESEAMRKSIRRELDKSGHIPGESFEDWRARMESNDKGIRNAERFVIGYGIFFLILLIASLISWAMTGPSQTAGDRPMTDIPTIQDTNIKLEAMDLSLDEQIEKVMEALLIAHTLGVMSLNENVLKTTIMAREIVHIWEHRGQIREPE